MKHMATPAPKAAKLRCVWCGLEAAPPIVSASVGSQAIDYQGPPRPGAPACANRKACEKRVTIQTARSKPRP